MKKSKTKASFLKEIISLIKHVNNSVESDEIFLLSHFIVVH
jgi:hypothetical protein